VDVGERTLAMAQRLVHQVTQVLAPACIPLFLPDGFREYLTALVTHYGQWRHPERRQVQGPRPQPRWRPLPGLLSAQVVQSYRQRRIVRVQHRVLFGSAATVESMLAQRRWTIHTSFVERLTLAFRQHVAAIGQRVNTLGTHATGLRQQLVLFQTDHNCMLPHASVRVPLPDVTQGTAAGKRWQQRTPAMAAGLTDRVWSLREVRMSRGPPWPQPQVGEGPGEVYARQLPRANCIYKPSRGVECSDARSHGGLLSGSFCACRPAWTRPHALPARLPYTTTMATLQQRIGTRICHLG
jgi:hypothetical protein